MPASDYVLWVSEYLPNVCRLRDIKGYKDFFRLNRGERVASGFPAGVTAHMDDRHPHDTLLADNLRNLKRVLIVSERLKAIVVASGALQVEYLPLAVVDHKGRAVGTPYFIVHPTDPVDCLDLTRCGAEWSPIDKTIITEMAAFHLDDAKLDDSRNLFRAKAYHYVTLVRRDLAAAIDAAAVTGVRWAELADFRKI